MNIHFLTRRQFTFEQAQGAKALLHIKRALAGKTVHLMAEMVEEVVMS